MCIGLIAPSAPSCVWPQRPEGDPDVRDQRSYWKYRQSRGEAAAERRSRGAGARARRRQGRRSGGARRRGGGGRFERSRGARASATRRAGLVLAVAARSRLAKLLGGAHAAARRRGQRREKRRG